VHRLVAQGLVENPDALLDRSADEWIIALDQDDDVVGGALVTVDRTWAMLNVLVGMAYPIRYALHTGLVVRRGAAGVQYLFTSDESALVKREGVQYLQHLLGCRVVDLRPPPTQRPHAAARAAVAEEPPGV
jgi:hypothetical protein